MANLTLAAADFRLHLPRLLEKVAYDDTRVLVQRYGHKMVAVVSLEDWEYLERNKPLRKKEQAQPIFREANAAAEALGLMSTTGEDVLAKAQERKAEEKRRREEQKAAEAAERERQEMKERALQQELRTYPGHQEPEKVRELYREVFADRSDPNRWTWRISAWDYLVRIGRTEGLEPPPSYEDWMRRN